MERLTREAIEAIRKRAEAASVGWIAVDGGYVGSIDDEGNEIVIAECDTEANAYFIGEARQDIPKLLAEIERLNALSREMSEQMARANSLIEDVHELLYDSIYVDHPTFDEVSEYLNVRGERFDQTE